MKLLRLLSILLLLGSFACKSIQPLTRDDVGALGKLRADITYLASDALEGRETGTRGGQLAAEYIAQRMKQLGLKPAGDDGTYFQEFAMPQFDPHNPHSATSVVQGKNVIGFIDKKAPYTIVIGAHYDHLGYGTFGSLYTGTTPAIHNGADDNASGVAGLLHLAEVCKTRYKGHNFLFVAFAGEERGLLGSNYFVKHQDTDLAHFNYMLNMDMIGRLKTERALAINGVGTSPQWMPVLNTIQVDSIVIVTSESGTGPSDHTSFYYENIPALHFFTGQHEDYHKPSDDVERINFPGLLSVLRYIETVIARLDTIPRLEFTQTADDRQQMRSDFKVTLGVMPDYLYNGNGMRIDGVRPDRPADKAGMTKGDIILRMGDIEITDMMAYMEALGEFAAGEQILVAIEREGKVIELKVTFD